MVVYGEIGRGSALENAKTYGEGHGTPPNASGASSSCWRLPYRVWLRRCCGCAIRAWCCLWATQVLVVEGGLGGEDSSRPLEQVDQYTGRRWHVQNATPGCVSRGARVSKRGGQAIGVRSKLTKTAYFSLSSSRPPQSWSHPRQR